MPQGVRAHGLGVLVERRQSHLKSPYQLGSDTRLGHLRAFISLSVM